MGLHTQMSVQSSRAAYALLGAICALLMLPSLALAATTGSIEGTVVEAGLAKKPIKGLCVAAYPSNRSFYGGTWEVTNANGEYEIEKLAPGSYKVRFFKCEEEEQEGFLSGADTKLNYAPRYYHEQSVAADAEAVKVEAGKVAEDIDAEMKPGAEIYGEVLNAQGAALEHVCVSAYPITEDGPQEPVYTESGASGVYELTGLLTGSYAVAYNDCGPNVAAAYYDEASSTGHHVLGFESATKVSVTAETEPADIDELLPVHLEAGAVIEGSISDSEGHAITAPMCIGAFAANDEVLGNSVYSATGHYRIEGLDTGTYDLEIIECGAFESKPVWAPQYYNGVSDISEATAVSVTAGLEPAVSTTANFTLVRSSAVKPASIAAPGIAGSAEVGQTLTCSPGSWSGTPAPSYSYQWLKEGSAIAGATSATYVVQAADEGHSLACKVTATNEAGSASETSASVAVPVVPPPTSKTGTADADSKAPVKAGVVQITLTCTGGGACKGTLKLTAQATVASGKHHKHKIVKVTIGEMSFAITAGAHETLDVHLSPKGKSLLAKAGKHGLSVQLSGTGVNLRMVLLEPSNRGHSKPKKHKG